MGNFLSGRRATMEAGQRNEPLPVPTWLDAELHSYWRTVTALAPGEFAREPDTLLLAQLCEHLYVKDQAWRQLREAGITELDTAHNNEVRRHPAVMIWRQAADGARQCMSLLGMSPVSRARLKADAAESVQSEFLAFLQRRNGNSQASG
jgi:P27 family predicted phage terminase small subunit